MNRHFETTFETGVDEMSWDDTVSGMYNVLICLCGRGVCGIPLLP